MKDIDTGLLRSFLAVAETAGFSAAARRLNKSQSAISMQIKKLEEALEIRLFDRRPDGVFLSAGGQVFHVRARQIVDLHDAALMDLRDTIIKGRVKIAVMDDYATHILPAIFADFSALYPDIELEVTTGFTADLIHGLGERFDMVLATQPAHDLSGHVLRSDQICWAFAVDKPLPDMRVVPLALLSTGNLFRQWAVEALDGAGRIWRVCYSSTSISACESAAAAGIAVTVVKASTAREDLRFLGEKDGLPSLPSCNISLHLKPAELDPAGRQLSAFLVKRIR